MSPRGGGERTPEEREAARRARERRRYERSGEPIPDELLEPHERAATAPEPAAPEPEPFVPLEPQPRAPQPRAGEPEPPAQSTQPPAREPEPPASRPAAPAPQESADSSQETQQWDVNEAWVDEQHQAHPAAEPTPAAHDPQATQLHDVTSDWTDEHPVADGPPLDPAASTPPPASPSPADPGTGEHEEPLGTRRVSRAHLPNIHRPTGSGNRRSDIPRRGRRVRVKRPGEVAAGGARKRRSAGPRIAAFVVVLLVLIFLWFVNSTFQPFGGGDGSGQIVVTIPRGASAGDIGDLLADRGVISSSFFFGLRASVSGKRSDLKSGTYRLRRDMGYGAALDALTEIREAPQVPVVKVAIPEGRSRKETVAIARRAGLRGDYLTASRRSARLNPARYGAPRDATLEGFLFPATYDVKKGGSVRTLVDDQLRAFQQNFATVNLGYAKSKRLTAFDVLTIAAMVEREVSIPRERPLVAAVIYNRLRDGIPLGIDATLRFEQNDWVNPLKQSVLDADTPYNTRTKQGLPPGPIGSPGLASIRAAAHPANSRALYYVVKPGVCGEHAFSDTFERFQADVATYNQARAAAGGKSPQRC
ncbi:endolytic transglycosylase MltG [Conexibacter sp. CPCC 206217]|uniref:endolytic transglycosylase MltG n=1 Tax=Conexibacter sp. CPCC 206217 TaxID=3064574 RepID=UPI0027289F63|nr:endolytic transglycosylase MltG [Conexibacter sp. CPCC 206217]MDO8210838.1 endolytic transglycosylase MltG [Conexibacter sp. CPCC 206217]